LHSIVFIFFRTDHCNYLLVGLPKVRRSSLQSVPNAAARWIVRLPRTSHICLHVWPSSLAPTRIQFNGSLIDIYKYIYIGHISDLIPSATSLRPLRSLDRHHPFARIARTSMVHTRAFAITGLALRSQLPPSTRCTLYLINP